MVMPAMQVAVQHAAGREALGSAIGAMSLSRSVGGAIGVAAIGAVIYLSIGHADPALNRMLARAMSEGPDYLGHLSGSERAAISAQLDHTFRLVFFSSAAITGVGTLVATTVPKPSL
jgi:hypothetical protein